jgi:hypothetical protein
MASTGLRKIEETKWLKLDDHKRRKFVEIAMLTPSVYFVSLANGSSIDVIEYEKNRALTKEVDGVEIIKIQRQEVNCGKILDKVNGLQEYSNGIRFIKGDFLTYKFPASMRVALAHCVGTDLIMGAGVAIAFKKRFNKEQELRTKGMRIGDVLVQKVENLFVCYLGTKLISKSKDQKDKPTMESFLVTLATLFRYLVDEEVDHLYIPPLGTGRDNIKTLVFLKFINYFSYITKIDITVIENNDQKLAQLIDENKKIFVTEEPESRFVPVGQIGEKWVPTTLNQASKILIKINCGACNSTLEQWTIENKMEININAFLPYRDLERYFIHLPSLLVEGLCNDHRNSIVKGLDRKITQIYLTNGETEFVDDVLKINPKDFEEQTWLTTLQKVLPDGKLRQFGVLSIPISQDARTKSGYFLNFINGYCLGKSVQEEQMDPTDMLETGDFLSDLVCDLEKDKIDQEKLSKIIPEVIAGQKDLQVDNEIEISNLYATILPNLKQSNLFGRQCLEIWSKENFSNLFFLTTVQQCVKFFYEKGEEMNELSFDGKSGNIQATAFVMVLKDMVDWVERSKIISYWIDSMVFTLQDYALSNKLNEDGVTSVNVYLFDTGIKIIIKRK